MSIVTGQTILASDFVSTSAGSGDSGKVPKLNSNGKLDESFLQFFSPHSIPIEVNATSARFVYVTSNQTGTTLYIVYDLSSTTATILRFARDTKSGLYYQTHSTTLTIDSSYLTGIAVCGNYVYVTARIATVQSLRRYDAADLANVTTMTGLTDASTMWSDGTYLWVYSNPSQWKKYSISGTTVTDLGSTTFTSSGTNPIYGCISNGTYVWISDTDGTGTFTIRKYNITGGAALSTTSTTLKVNADYNGANPQLFIWSTTLLGIAWQYNAISPTAVTATKEYLTLITLP